MRAGALKVRHLARYRDIALLLKKHARAGLGDGAGDGAGPRELAEDLERLGPTFVKLGQLLSTRSDFLPAPYVEELERLQDHVGPFPFASARRIVESELGAPLSANFREFDEAPVAAASLSQIHRARLRGGREVAVKVQRPGIRERIRDDMEALIEAAAFLDRRTRFGRRYELGRIVAEFRKTMTRELDFAQEALNLRELAGNLESFERIVVPSPVEDLTTTRVLTMDWIDARKLKDGEPTGLSDKTGRELARELFRAYLKQILVDGFFHADPHPGNIVVAPGRRLAILDLGMVERLGPQLQQDLLVLLLAIGEGRAEDAGTAGIRIGAKRDGFDEAAFRARVSELVLAHQDATISELNMGRIIFEIARFSGQCGLRMPSEMTMIGKALLNLDRVVAALDPRFEPSQTVRDESMALLQDSLERSLSRSNVASVLLDVQRFASKLPERLGKALDVIGGNEIRLKVDSIDETLMIQGMQKIANRIALGVVLASLIIGAALMMQVETTFRVFEYPGLAIILFLGAAAGALFMILDILWYDEKRRAKPRGRREG
jgi:ubiquinone biosynthesis protein